MEEKIRKLEEAEQVLEKLKDDKELRKSLYKYAVEGYGPDSGSAALACVGFYLAIDGAVKISD